LIAGPALSEKDAQTVFPGCEVKIAAGLDEDSLIQAVSGWQADALCMGDRPISDRILERCPTLKAIQSSAAETGSLDWAAASRRGVRILYTPDEEAVCAAEHTIALLLALSRNLKTVYRQAVEGGMPYPYPAQWRTQREVETKHFLLLGLGAVGRELIRKAQGLDLNISVYDPQVSARELEGMAQKAEDLSKALGEADYVSLHPVCCPPVPHMGRGQFAAMKQGAFFLCTSQAVQVDLAALTQALQSRRLAGAGMDLSPQTPFPADSPLFQMDQVILASPCAGGAAQWGIRSCKRAVSALAGALDGGTPDGLVNERELRQVGFLPQLQTGGIT